MTTQENVVIATPLGPLELALEGPRLERVNFLSGQIIPMPYAKRSECAQKIADWFECYFKNPRACFALPLLLRGTPFQVRVWKALQHIPLGQTVTYGHLAKGLETSARAIGLACRQNPLPIVIPCHRVVAQSGLGGYCGKMNGNIFDYKISLIAHEKTASMLRESK
jgi:methylated-DNA-[protein]-cysteine S-methyltransferase